MTSNYSTRLQNRHDIPGALALLEYHVTAAVLNNFPAGVTLAHAEGCYSPLIGQDDLRYIFSAAETVASRNGTRSDALCVAKMGLQHFDEWGAWSDEKLVAFAFEHRGRPCQARDLARAVVALHAEWADAAEEHGPLYCPPPGLGQLNPIKLGLAIARLSRLSSVPVDWLHARFAQICAARDARQAIFTVGPVASVAPLVTNARAGKRGAA